MKRIWIGASAQENHGGDKKDYVEISTKSEDENLKSLQNHISEIILKYFIL